MAWAVHSGTSIRPNGSDHRSAGWPIQRSHPGVQQWRGMVARRLTGNCRLGRRRMRGQYRPPSRASSSSTATSRGAEIGFARYRDRNHLHGLELCRGPQLACARPKQHAAKRGRPYDRLHAHRLVRHGLRCWIWYQSHTLAAKTIPPHLPASPLKEKGEGRLSDGSPFDLEKAELGAGPLGFAIGSGWASS